jgi:hypothetical protein
VPALPYARLFPGVDVYPDWNLQEMIKILGTTRQPLRISDVLDITNNTFEQSSALRQIMWLLKYGFVRVAPDLESEATVAMEDSLPLMKV